MKKMHCIVIGALMFPLLSFAEPAQVSKADNLREKPFSDGKIVLPLKTGMKVDIQKREGAWYNVKVGTKAGWAPMQSVHRTTPAAPASSGSLSKTATGRSASGSVVSTTGIRGLNEENLKTAAFSEEAVLALEKNRVAPAAATSFAHAAGLAVHEVPILDSKASEGGVR